ncbi:hypothetical protein ACFSS9_19405 [Paenibacillus septentrionalis]|uniref:hypothetical protein n=1 Tax=Paenibacillus septentrionalis TaxID=429342 RepID=UPI003639E044
MMKKLSIVIMVALLTIVGALGYWLPSLSANDDPVKIQATAERSVQLPSTEVPPLAISNGIESILRYEIAPNKEVLSAVLKLSIDRDDYNGNSIAVHIAQEDNWPSTPDVTPAKLGAPSSVQLTSPDAVTGDYAGYYRYSVDVTNLLTTANIAVGEPDTVSLILSSNTAMQFMTRQDCGGDLACEAALAPHLEVVYGALNNAPTNISLSSTTVNQSAVANEVVGTLTTTDADAGDTHTYELVAGAGSTHNELFNIAGNQLRVNNASLMAANTYFVRIRTTDTGGASKEIEFSIAVVDDIAPNFNNGTPTFSNTTKLGTTLTVQLNETGTVYYVVLPDNAAAPSAEQVKAGHNNQNVTAPYSGSVVVHTENINMTTELSGLTPGTAYDIYVVAEDSKQNKSDVIKRDVLTVANIAPTDISLSADTINQSSGADAVVGTLTTTDADAVDTHTYTLVSGNGSTHNELFNIASGQLRANNSSQLTPGNYSVRVRSTDTGNEFIEKAFTITVVDDMAPNFTNGTPTASDETKSGLTLTVQLDEAGMVYYVLVDEGAAAPSAAQLKAGNDAQDAEALQSGSIVVGAAATDATRSIVGLSTHTAYDIYVVAEDSALNQSTVSKLDVSTAANSAPTAISLDDSTVNQSAGANAVVGRLTTTDADAGDTHTYTLITGEGSTDNASFAIAGDQLQANDASQLAAGTDTYAVRIRTTDEDGGTYEESFTITVVDDVAPSFANGTPTTSDVTKTGLTLTVQLNEAGKVYYVVVADEADAPSVTQVKAGDDAGDAPALQSGSIEVDAADRNEIATISGLTEGKTYQIYVVAEDKVSTPNTQSSATKLDVSMVANSAPTAISLDNSTVDQSAGRECGSRHVNDNGCRRIRYAYVYARNRRWLNR